MIYFSCPSNLLVSYNDTNCNILSKANIKYKILINSRKANVGFMNGTLEFSVVCMGHKLEVDYKSIIWTRG